VGIDLVAMSVNDILVCGATAVLPRLLSLRKARCARRAQVARASVAGCELAGCALIGARDGEHPNAFPKDEYDLAGSSRSAWSRRIASSTGGRSGRAM